MTKLSPLTEQFLSFNLQGRYKLLTTLSDADDLKLRQECAAAGKIEDYFQATHVLAVMHDDVKDQTHPYWTQKQGHLHNWNPPAKAEAPAAPLWTELGEVDQLVAFARMTNTERAKLRSELKTFGVNDPYLRACISMDLLHPAVVRPHPRWVHHQDLISHLGALGVDNPVAFVTAHREHGEHRTTCVVDDCSRCKEKA